MSFLDELKKLTRPYDDEDDEDMDDAERLDEPAPRRARPNPFSDFSGSPAAQTTASSAYPQRPREGKVVNLGSAGNTLQVVLVRPERFETAAEIADHLREKRAVLVNLETTPKDVTRRLVDFLSGVAYAIDGRVKKVASNTYIITPPSVDLMGDLMDELENSGAYL
jgi:cell division inhibitor SepF